MPTTAADRVLKVDAKEARVMMENAGFPGITDCDDERMEGILNELMSHIKLLHEPRDDKSGLRLWRRIGNALADEMRIVVVNKEEEVDDQDAIAEDDSELEAEGNGEVEAVKRPGRPPKDSDQDDEETAPRKRGRKPKTDEPEPEPHPMVEMELRMVPIEDLVKAAYNPPERTEDRMKGLIASIREIGLQNPILASRNNGEYKVKDGHRRVAACKILGYDKVPTIISDSDNDDRVYADVNACSMHLQGKQKLHVYLKNKDAVAASDRKRLEKAQNDLSMGLLRLIHKAGLSAQVYTDAKRVARYLDRKDDKGFLETVVKYILHHRTAGIRQALKDEIPARQLEKYITANKPLVAKKSYED